MTSPSVAAPMLLRARAPLRVSFAGGGTDVPPFPQQEGGLVLNATIARYAYGTLVPRTDRQVHIESVDFGVSVEFSPDEPVTLDGKLDLAKGAIRKLGRDGAPGFELLLRSGAPPGSGLGSSSAVMVALIGLLRDFHQLALDPYDIAHLAYVVERQELGIAGGLQDQYAAVFGGFNFIEFEADRVIVNPLRIPPATLHELEHNLLLCYTGRTRMSEQIIEDQTSRVEQAQQETLSGMRMQKDLAIRMKNALLRNELTTFGELLGEAWASKQTLSPKIATPQIDETYEAATRAGALGGKVTGAGGGGYMLFYCPYRCRHRVAKAVEALGLTVSELSFENRGLETWTASSE